mgnify:CR=1 FL=1
MTDQLAIPAVFMRGGTSRGLMFHKNDLPFGPDKLSEYLLKIMGSPDIRQINGMGGGTSVTSKVCIISKSFEKDVDIDYLFAQVEVDRAYVDFEPTCGNMLSAVGPFAIEEGLVKPFDGQTRVRVRSVNTGSLTNLDILTPNSKVIYNGNYKIDGVPFKGAPVLLNFLELEGVKTGKLFPTNEFVTKIDDICVTCIDLGNPMVLALAKDFSIKGNESYEELNLNRDLFKRIEEIRKTAALKMGMGDVTGKVLPKFALLSSSNKAGKITSRYFTPYSCHQTHAVTGSLCIASSCLIPSTIAYSLFEKEQDKKTSVIIEHPLGEIQCSIDLNRRFRDNLNQKSNLINMCGIYRTSRKIMKGFVYVPI